MSDERATFSSTLALVAAVLVIGGLVLLRAGGTAVGLVLLCFGVLGVLQAVIVRIGLSAMPETKQDRKDTE